MTTAWTDRIYRLRSTGWQFLLAAALLLLSMALIFLMLLPRHDLLEQLTHQMAMHAASPVKKSHQTDSSPQAVLNAFYKLLPQEEEASKVFQQILVVANDKGVQPEKSEYQSVRNGSAAFTRYQMTMPMRGRYVDIRQFIILVLNELPNVALSEISFKRNEASPLQVEARVRFSIYTSRGVL